MKKILLILSTLFTLNSFSQTYFPFPDSLGIWRQASFVPADVSHTHIKGYPYVLYINGDTTISTYVYHKLFISDSTYNFDSSNSKYYGAIREDNKKIYFHPDSTYNAIHYYPFCNATPLNFNDEFLLYDFGVTLGDTVFYPAFDSTFIIITSVDSILIQNDFRKKYSYSIHTNASFCWGAGNYTEGIGSNQSGLFSHIIGYFENSEGLSCFEDVEVFYSNVTDCTNPLLSVNENTEALNLKVYPNPTTNKLFIETTGLAQNEKIEISFFDISGKKHTHQR
tara:strand:+ start:924 stop:1763 length:840 start_codon:yes stop_codon:yes gene_type:complete